MTDSLFCHRYQETAGRTGFPYHFWLQGQADRDSHRFPGVEAHAFAQVMEHEIQYYEHRGLCAGPISIRLKDGSALGSVDDGHRFRIPTWVESDNVQFGDHPIAAVVLVEAWAVFDRLCRAKAWRKLNVVLICGHGIPRAGTRRFTHRLAEHSKAPVYLLTDNDTWGYFIFSLLKRGLLAPHEQYPWLAINDLRFLGIRAGDARDAIKGGLPPREWQSGWDARLRCLRRYDCFASEEWRQRELRGSFGDRAGRSI